MNLKPVLIVSAVALCGAAPAFGHHSHAMYDNAQELTIRGTVKEFQWVNPHSWLYVTVTSEANGTQDWALEARAPARLAQQGWSPDSVRPGEAVSVVLQPLKFGGYGGLLRSVTLPDGRELVDE